LDPICGKIEIGFRFLRKRLVGGVRRLSGWDLSSLIFMIRDSSSYDEASIIIMSLLWMFGSWVVS